MGAENLSTILIFGTVALGLGAVLYKIVQHGGFKGAMFGARIDRTVGEVAGGGVKLMKVRLRIHKLGGGLDRAVGVELVAKSFASYQMMPVTLSNAEARRLIGLLEVATGGPDVT